jgi:hypothetical protein
MGLFVGFCMTCMKDVLFRYLKPEERKAKSCLFVCTKCGAEGGCSGAAA